MAIEPEIFAPGGVTKLWDDDKSPLKALRSHERKIKFLKGELKEEPIYKMLYAKLYKVIDPNYLEKIGKLMDMLYDLRRLLNYEGMIIAHQAREELNVRREKMKIKDEVEEAAGVAVEVAHKINEITFEVFNKWYEKQMLLIGKKLAKAYTCHLLEEVEQFKKLVEPLGFDISHIQFLLELLNKYHCTQSDRLQGYVIGFMSQTYDFRYKEIMYKKLININRELRRLISTL